MGSPRGEFLGDVGDSLVDLTEQSLIFRQSSKASFHTGRPFQPNAGQTCPWDVERVNPSRKCRSGVGARRKGSRLGDGNCG